MPKVLLSVAELITLDQALIETHAFFRDLRNRTGVARLIHYPSIPSDFSESLTIHCAKLFFGDGWAAQFGGSISDIQLCRNDERQNVEVKATTQTGFQEFKPKDLSADFIVWIHFGNRYINGAGSILIYVLHNPSKYIRTPLRLKMPVFLKLTHDGSVNGDRREFEVDSLQGLLSRRE